MAQHDVIRKYTEGTTLKVWSTSGVPTFHIVRKRLIYMNILNLIRLNYPELTDREHADLFVPYCVDNGYLTVEENPPPVSTWT